MGMVYKAHDQELDEMVAVKVLRADIARSADLGRRFRSEIKLARSVRHRNVCGIHEYGHDGHLRFIAMELIEGVDLKQILRDHGPLSAAECCDVAIQVAHGLDAIHEAGIVHRDLKTPNIMRDHRGVVRVMDFGVAKRFEGGTVGATAAGHVVGTPEYMSPEQAQGLRVDHRSDIYALGVVVFELMTGDVPFRGDTPIVTMFKHIQEPPPLDEPGARRLPASLIPVLRKALAKHPDERFASALEMADALQTARLHLPVVAPSMGVPLVCATAPKLEATPDTLRFDPPTPLPSGHSTPAPLPTTTPMGVAVVALGGSPADPSLSRGRPNALFRGHWMPVALAGAALLGSAAIGGWLVLRSSGVPRREVAALPTTMTPAQLPTSTGSGPEPAQLPAPPPAPVADAAGSPILPAPRVRRQGGPASEVNEEMEPVRLEWLPVRGAKSYRVIVADSPSFDRPVFDRRGVERAFVVMPGLKSGTYYWRVSASDDRAAESAPSEIARLRIAPPPPQQHPGRVRPGAGPTEVPPQNLKPSPIPSPSASGAEEKTASAGVLRLLVLPWADVMVDGLAMGTTPMKPLSLSPGVHLVILENPNYQPLQKKVTVRTGQTTFLEVDLSQEAFPK